MSTEEENTVLSQDNIDALISATAEFEAPAQAPASAPPPQAAAPAAAAPPPASPAAAPSAGGSAPDDLAQRIAKLEAQIAKVGPGAGGNPQLEANVQALAKQVQAISAQLNEALQHLPNTLGYGVRATFQCAACSTQSHVAARVFCTQCGTETALGWWPQT